jgi:hypothetical protein
VPGVPIIQQVLTDKEKVEPKRQVRFYQLLFPDFVPTETQAGGGDFRVAAEVSPQLLYFGNIRAVDFSGILASVQSYMPYRPTAKPITEPCPGSSGRSLQGLIKAYDFDRRGPDLSILQIAKINSNYQLGGNEPDMSAYKKERILFNPGSNRPSFVRLENASELGLSQKDLFDNKSPSNENVYTTGNYNLLLDDNGETQDMSVEDRDTYTLGHLGYPHKGFPQDIAKYNKANQIREKDYSKQLYMLTAIDTHGIWKKLLQQPGKVAEIRIFYENGHSTLLHVGLTKAGSAQQWAVSCGN